MANLNVFIGRFQPFHRGHMVVVLAALETSSYLVMLIGSSGEPSTLKNPFSFTQRKDVIQAVFRECGIDLSKICILPLYDNRYDDAAWVNDVTAAVNQGSDTLANIHNVVFDKTTLVGHNKDSSSYYLKLFPEYNTLEVGAHNTLSATDIRNRLYFTDPQHILQDEYLYSTTYKPVIDFLHSFFNQNSSLHNQYAWKNNYLMQRQGVPYPECDNSITVDAVVTCHNYILLIKRAHDPGRDLWALPGGFVESSETIDAATVRELREETTLDLRNTPHVKKSTMYFDDPDRSELRNRILTFATHFAVHDQASVVGSDDASTAFWVDISTLTRLNFYSDHFYIIQKMLSKE